VEVGLDVAMVKVGLTTSDGGGGAGSGMVEVGLDVAMVKVGLTMAQLRLTIDKDGAGVGHGDGGGGVDYAAAEVEHW